MPQKTEVTQQFGISPQDYAVLSDQETQVWRYFSTLDTIDAIKAKIANKKAELLTPDIRAKLSELTAARKQAKELNESSPPEQFKQTYVRIAQASKAVEPYREAVEKATEDLRTEQKKARASLPELRKSIALSFNNSFIMSLVRK
jgi:hypothetical protein